MTIIEKIRKKSGLSQGQFARLVGVTRITVYRWEAGESVPTAENLKKIREVLTKEYQENQGVEETLDEYIKLIQDGETVVIEEETPNEIEKKESVNVSEEVETRKQFWRNVLSKLVLVLSVLSLGVSRFFIVLCACILYNENEMISVGYEDSYIPAIPIEICWVLIAVCSITITGSGFLIVRYFLKKK